jgi:hypothetical protein
MMKTCLLSGFLFDVVLAGGLFVRGVVHTALNWETSQQWATGMQSVFGTMKEWFFMGLVYWLAAALATYFTLRLRHINLG